MTLAVANYESLNKCLPQRCTENGFSWRVTLLPFKEESRLFESLDHCERWDSPANSAFHLPVPHGLKCHNREDNTPNTQMFAVTSTSSVWRDGGTTFSEISDPTSDTLMLIELDFPGTNWMAPKDVSLGELIEILESDGRLPSLHPDGVLMSFADGRVRCVPHEKITSKFLRAIVSIDGGENVKFE